jgi:hypothetical protein
LDFLQKSLDIASVGNVKPKGITQLAKFCARLIGEWERTGPEEASIGDFSNKKSCNQLEDSASRRLQALS